MRKSDYQRLIELCSVERATAPYSLINVVPPQHMSSLALSYDQHSTLDAGLSKKISAEWDIRVKQAEANGNKMFSKPLMRYKGHTVRYNDDAKATVTINLGATSYAEHTLAHKVDPSKVAWSFGPSSFVIIEDDEQKRYILFGDRSKAIAHTAQAVEREFFQKGYFYTDNLKTMVASKEIDLIASLSSFFDYSFKDNPVVVEKLIRSQLRDQTNFTEEMVSKATIEIVGAFLIPSPHFDANASGVINVKLPCKAKDFGQFHKGKKYTSSTLVKFEDITTFVDREEDNLTPISRAELYQWAVRHPELVE